MNTKKSEEFEKLQRQASCLLVTAKVIYVELTGGFIYKFSKF